MAKKKETTSLIEALLEYQELKSIDRNTLIAVMEDSLRNVLSKMFGSDDTFDVIINVEKKGDFEIWRTRHVVADDDFVDEVREVPLSEAQRVDPDIAVGEDFVDAVRRWQARSSSSRRSTSTIVSWAVSASWSQPKSIRYGSVRPCSSMTRATSS